MKIVLSLKNGHTLQFLNCTQNDFEMFVEHMSSIKSAFTWNDHTWVRKKDVSAFSLVPMEEKAGA